MEDIVHVLLDLGARTIVDFQFLLFHRIAPDNYRDAGRHGRNGIHKVVVGNLALLVGLAVALGVGGS